MSLVLLSATAQTVPGKSIVCINCPYPFHNFTVLSSLPLTKVESKYLTENTNPVCDENVANRSSWLDHNFNVSSLEHVMNPTIGTAWISLMMSPCAYLVYVSFPLSQSLRMPSWLPLMIFDLVIPSTATPYLCPSNFINSPADAISHIMAVASHDPDIMVYSSMLLNEHTLPWWPSRVPLGLP